MKGLPSGPLTVPVIEALNAAGAKQTDIMRDARTLSIKRMSPFLPVHNICLSSERRSAHFPNGSKRRMGDALHLGIDQLLRRVDPLEHAPALHPFVGALHLF